MKDEKERLLSYSSFILHGKGVAVRFLAGTCGFWAILAGVRHCPGVTPKQR
jgi:hypothetical protein